MTIIVSVMCRPKIVLVECVGHSSVVCYLAQVLEPLSELVILQFS